MSSTMHVIDDKVLEDKKDSITEGFEDAESEAEWADGLSLHGSETIIGSFASFDESNDLPQEALVDELIEKNKTLERKLREAEKKYQNLRTENERLNIQFINEKQKSIKYFKKFKFIQDNQEIFNRLKQAYLSMKYNEAAGRPMVEIREKASQTWEGILCRACIQTAEFNQQKQLEDLCLFASPTRDKEKDENAVITVKKNDLTRIDDTVQKLREMINKRELSWSYNKERESKLKVHIVNLEMENSKLKEFLKKKESKQTLMSTIPVDVAINTTKEIGTLKKIIVKMEKRRREIEKTGLCHKLPTPLNENESSIVEHIMTKYFKRIQKQHENSSRSKSCDRIANKNFNTCTNSMPNTARNDVSGSELFLGRGDSGGTQHKIDLIDFSDNAV